MKIFNYNNLPLNIVFYTFYPITMCRVILSEIKILRKFFVDRLYRRMPLIISHSLDLNYVHICGMLKIRDN